MTFHHRLTRLLLAGLFTILSIAGISQSGTIEKWKITDVEKYIAESKTPVIINFWATFCKPCIEEIPYFEEAIKKYQDKGINMVLVSLDIENFYPEKIRKFADKNNFKSRITWLDEYDADYFCPRIDKSWSGAIPATLFVNNQTGYRSFFEDKIPEEKLLKEIEALVQNK